MESQENDVKSSQVVDARARNISHNVRCTECGSQSIEDSQADIAVLLRKVSLIPRVEILNFMLSKMFGNFIKVIVC